MKQKNPFNNEDEVIECLQQLDEEQLVNIIQRANRALELKKESEQDE